jgi:hypothetical protein
MLPNLLHTLLAQLMHCLQKCLQILYKACTCYDLLAKMLACQVNCSRKTCKSVKDVSGVRRDYCQGCQMVCFQTKIPIWVNFGGSCNGKARCILRPFGVFYCNWKYLMVVWYILSSFGIFFPVLVFCAKKNPATPTTASR